jgi:hypothetical protein
MQVLHRDPWCDVHLSDARRSGNLTWRSRVFGAPAGQLSPIDWQGEGTAPAAEIGFGTGRDRDRLHPYCRVVGPGAELPLRRELDPQVPLEDVLGPQICGGPGEHDLTTVHHVRVVGELKGPGDVLLDEE